MSSSSPVQLLLDEILASERSYVSQLEVLMQLYVLPLSKSPEKYNLTPDFCPKVFGNIAALQQINIGFLCELEVALGPQFEDEVDCVEKRVVELGRILNLFAPQFKMYTYYTASFNNSRQLLTQVLNDEYNEVLDAFLEAAVRNPVAKGNNLQSFLIMPVQRVPRYILLLKELLKLVKLMPHKSDMLKNACTNLSSTLIKLEESAAQINESIRSREMGEMMSSLQDELGLDLLIPGRVLCKRGKLMKLSDSWQPNAVERTGKICDFYLFSDLLLYVAPKLFGTGSKIRQIPVDYAFASSLVQEEIMGKPRLPLLSILTGSRFEKNDKQVKNKNVVIQFDSMQEAVLWQAEFEKCRNLHLRQRYSMESVSAAMQYSNNKEFTSAESFSRDVSPSSSGIFQPASPPKSEKMPKLEQKSLVEQGKSPNQTCIIS